jgi:hypothetical protein
MVPLRIVGLEKPYLKGLGLQEMFCAQSANPNKARKKTLRLVMSGFPLFTGLSGRGLLGNWQRPVSSIPKNQPRFPEV